MSAGRDLAVSTRTFQIFVGSECQNVSVTPDGTVRVDRAGGEPPAQPVADNPTAANPYKGLEAFNEADADRFFGREAVIARLWQRCRELTQPAIGEGSPLTLLPIIGPSGCGKSSLVRAGLLPELARRPLPGLGNPRAAVLVPGSHPVDALAAVLARMATGDPAAAAKQTEFAELLLADETGSRHALRRIARFLTGQGQALLLVVDQFEEVWSLCDVPKERAAFISGLLDVVTDRDARVCVALTLRSDFLVAANGHPELSQAISRRAFLVPAMSAPQLRAAIAEPARRAGHIFDDATIELIVAGTEGREGVLPLLEFALTRIWEGLKLGVSAAETLRRLGGVGGALAKEAERLYRELPEADQRIVRRAFLAQVRLGEATANDTRRRAPIDEIVAIGEDREHVLSVLRYFSRQGEPRLITLGSDPSSGTVTAELAHEALLEHWDDLKKWIDDGRADLRFHRRVLEAAEHWKGQGKPPGLLWRRPDLDLLRGFHARRATDMTPLQMAFFRASEQQHRRECRRRLGTRATILAMIALVAVWSLWRNYAHWVEARPWARLVSISTGRSYPLRQDTANVGRIAEGVKEIKHQLPLRCRPVSRIHLSISNTGVITDWRSLYGTTLNGDVLPYGKSGSLTDGDILVLSGRASFIYRTIEWHPWHYLREPELPVEEAVRGWAVLIDGRRHAVLPINPDEMFVVLQNGRVELSEAPTEGALLAIRRRSVYRDPIRISRRSRVEALELDDGTTESRVRYEGYDAASAPKGDTSVMTLQLLPAATERVESWIKEGDYHYRHIVLPTDSQMFAIESAELHRVGEIVFATEFGLFQVVPTRATYGGKSCELGEGSDGAKLVE